MCTVLQIEILSEGQNDPLSKNLSVKQPEHWCTRVAYLNIQQKMFLF